MGLVGAEVWASLQILVSSTSPAVHLLWGFRFAFRSPRASLSLLTEFLSSCQSSFFTRSPSAQSRSPLSPFVCVRVCVRVSLYPSSSESTRESKVARKKKKLIPWFCVERQASKNRKSYLSCSILKEFLRFPQDD